MAWLILFLIGGVLGLACLIGGIWLGRDVQSREDGTAMTLFVFAGVLAIANIVMTMLFSIHIVDARNIGVVRTFGSITGQVEEGFRLTAPWQSVEEWEIRTQVVEPDSKCSNGADKCMDAGSVDIQDVYVKGVLNISVDPRDVQNLARNIGKNYKETIVLNRLNQVVKQTTARYKAQDILANREQIRTAIREQMTKELAEYSIRVDDFLITNVDFTPDFKEAIEAKVTAEQQAAAEENKIAIAEAQARQRAAVAEGEANRLRIEAQGQADANRLISSSITPTLVQWQAIQKLAGNIQIALVPDNALPIFDFGNLAR